MARPLVVVSAGIGIAASVALALSGTLVGGRTSLAAGTVLLWVVVSAGVAVLTQRGIAPFLLLLFVVNAVLTPMNSLRVGPFMGLSDTLLLVAVPVVAARQLLHPSATYTARFRPMLGALGLVAFGGLVASCLASDPLSGIPDLIRFSLSTIGLLVLMATWSPTADQVRILIWALGAGAGVSVIVGFVSGFSFVGRAVGLTSHPNHLGMASMLAMGGAFGLAMTAKPSQRKVAGALSLLLLLGVLVSGSRAALLGVIVFVLVFLLAMRTGRTLRWYGAVCVPLVCAVLLGIVQLPSANAFTRLIGNDPGTAASDFEREEIRIETFDRIRERPFTGSGFSFSRTAHALYLQLWASAGVLGLLGLTAIIVLTIGILVAGARARDALLVAMAASFLGYLAAGFASNILWDRYVWLHLALALALLAQARPANPPGEQQPPMPPEVQMQPAGAARIGWAR